jgi:hypothetical protein
MKTVLSRLGLILGAGFMVAWIATGDVPVPDPKAGNRWHAGTAVMVVLVAGLGWLTGWLIGWALDGLAKRKNAE